MTRSLPTHPMPTHKMTPATSSDDLDTRCAQLSGRILDGIAAILDEMAPDPARVAARRQAIARAVWLHTAPLVCPYAKCRRAQTCRRTPCSAVNRERRAARRDASDSHGDFLRAPRYAMPVR